MLALSGGPFRGEVRTEMVQTSRTYKIHARYCGPYVSYKVRTARHSSARVPADLPVVLDSGRPCHRHSECRPLPIFLLVPFFPLHTLPRCLLTLDDALRRSEIATKRFFNCRLRTTATAPEIGLAGAEPCCKRAVSRPRRTTAAGRCKGGSVPSPPVLRPAPLLHFLS